MHRLENLDSLKISFDAAGRSKGLASAVFKTHELAIQAQKDFHGEMLDGKQLQIELQGPFKKKGGSNQHKKGKDGHKQSGIEGRLGPVSNIFSRLAPKLEDRLGRKLEDRLGKKKNAPGGGKAKKIPENSGAGRQIKSYADTQVANNDGDMV